MKRWMLTCFAMLSLLLIVASPVAAAPGGNSTASARCEHGGYLRVTRVDDTVFKNEGQCTKYAAHGGELIPIPTAALDFVPILTVDDDLFCLARLTVTGYDAGTYTARFRYASSTTTLTVDEFGNGTVLYTSVGFYPGDSLTAYIDGVAVATKTINC